MTSLIPKTFNNMMESAPLYLSQTMTNLNSQDTSLTSEKKTSKMTLLSNNLNKDRSFGHIKLTTAKIWFIEYKLSITEIAQSSALYHSTKFKRSANILL